MKERVTQRAQMFRTIDANPRAANQVPITEILQAYKTPSFPIIQREANEEDELLQGKFDIIQREALPDEDEEPILQKSENKTRLPDYLKAEAFQRKSNECVVQGQFEAGFGNLWHVHNNHVKYNGDNASRTNFDGRTKSYVVRRMRAYHNTLAHNPQRHLSYQLCRRWIKDNL